MRDGFSSVEGLFGRRSRVIYHFRNGASRVAIVATLALTNVQQVRKVCQRLNSCATPASPCSEQYVMHTRLVRYFDNLHNESEKSTLC